MPELRGHFHSFKAAEDYFRHKVNLPRQRWDDLHQGQHTRAFVVAGAIRDALLVDMPKRSMRRFQFERVAGGKIMNVTDPTGAMVEVNGTIIEHWLDTDKRRGRERYLPFLQETIAFLVAMAADAGKPEEVVRMRVMLVAITDHLIEQQVQSGDLARLDIRDDLKAAEKAISQAASSRGVLLEQFGIFKDAGFRGMYKKKIGSASKACLPIPSRRKHTKAGFAVIFNRANLTAKFKPEGIFYLHALNDCGHAVILAFPGILYRGYAVCMCRSSSTSPATRTAKARCTGAATVTGLTAAWAARTTPSRSLRRCIAPNR